MKLFRLSTEMDGRPTLGLSSQTKIALEAPGVETKDLSNEGTYSSLAAKGTAGLLFIGLLGTHFQIASISGYPLTIAPLSCIAVAFLLTHRSRNPCLPVIIILIAVAPTLGYFLQIDTVDSTQFIRTFALYVFAVLLLSGLFGRKPSLLIRSGPVIWALQTILVIVVVLSVIQVITGLHGDLFFFNPFRSHQYLYQYNPGLEYSFPRAAGFYLEPAFNALVILAVGCSLVLLQHHPTRNILLMVAGVASSGSVSGLATLISILILFALTRKPAKAALTTLLVGVVLKLSGTYVIDRLTSIRKTGSSTNYRIEAPLAVLQHVLSSSPLGFPLGSVDTTMRKFGLPNGSTVGSTLDNGYYLLVFYFGLIGVLMCLLFVGYGIKLVLRQREMSVRYWPFGLSILALPLFTGGIILPEFLLAFGVLLLANRAATHGVKASP